MRIALIALLAVGSTSVQTTVYDGTFWMAASPPERVAFVEGYVDYHTAEGLSPTLPSASFHDFEQAITNYLVTRSTDRGRSLHDLFLEVAPKVPARRPSRNGERYMNKHGFFDLDYWGQSTAAERLKFLEGYLLAQRHDGRSKDRFSQTAQWYEERITNELDRRQKEKEDLDTPIADVLGRFKDKR